MELLISRDQKKGMLGMGAIKFVLESRAKLTDEEATAVRKYKMGTTIVYEKPNDGFNAKSLTSMLAHRFLVPRITVDELVSGKSIECADIVEILEAEDKIKEAAQVLHTMLKAAASFGGEEVIVFS